MNDVFLSLGVEGWKPILGSLLLPPVPFLLLVLVGARLMFTRRALAWLLVLLGVLGLWFMCSGAVARGLNQWLLNPPRALAPAEIAALKRAPKTAIVVLGGGRINLAPEYGVSTLTARSVERLRYGVWLARETGLPLAFSGGVGHGAPEGLSEAEIAGRIAEREFGLKLRWTEGESRDTHENAVRSVALLRASGVEHIVLVTQAYHMRRALKNFQGVIATSGAPMKLTAAPMSVSARSPLEVSDWLPSLGGFEGTRLALHEWLGRLAGA